MTKEQYNIVQKIYQKLLEIPKAKRSVELEKLTSDDFIKAEVLELFKNTSDLTIFSKKPHHHPLRKTYNKKPLDKISELFSSTVIFRTILFISLTLLLLLGLWTHNSVKNRLVEMTQNNIQRTINALHLSLDIWIKDYKHDVHTISNDPELRTAVANYLNEQGISKNEVRQLISNSIDLKRYSGFAIISLNAEVKISNNKQSEGYQLTEQSRASIARILAGEVIFGPPIIIPGWKAENKNRKSEANIWVSNIILDSDNKPIAVLSVGRPARAEFTELLTVSQLGETGESYAINQNGLMLTTSRFEYSLWNIGLLDSIEMGSELNLYVKDPGVSLKNSKPKEPKELWSLTKSAQAIQTFGLEEKERTGVIMEPYRDYRGEQVVGGWLWLPKYSFGLITEIDAAEAYAPMRFITFAFVILISVLSAFLVYSMFSSLKVVRLAQKVQKGKYGQYIITKQIGEGGMSTVYLAGHELLQRPTALKVLKPSALNDISIRRFKKEAQQISRLRNPNTIELYDYGQTEEGTLYYAMEYLDGLNIKELVKMNGALPINRGVHILLHTCFSLKEAHDLNLIHRDVKPQNVMVSVLGGIYDMVKVLDFGLVKDLENNLGEEFTQQAEITGTPLYMSPERITNPKSTDHRSDIYALGAMAFYMFGARPLFEYKNDLDVMYQIINTVPPKLSAINNNVPAMLSNLVEMCLEKEADHRPESIDVVIHILKQLKNEYPYSQAEAKKWWLRFLG